MDQIIVYVDEADHARQQIGPLRSTGAVHDAALSAQSTPATATHWIVVACPPKLPRDASKWVSAESVEGWRQDWASELFNELRPLFNAPGDKLTCVLATGELVKLTDTLIAEHGNGRVLDARCPKYDSGRAGGPWRVVGARRRITRALRLDSASIARARCYPPPPMKLILKWLLSAVALLVVAYIYAGGVQVAGFGAALLAAFVIGLMNIIVRPILVLLTLPVMVRSVETTTSVPLPALFSVAVMVADALPWPRVSRPSARMTARWAASSRD